MDGFLVVLTLITALGCGLSAGALFAFSSFVMQALARLTAAEGVAAMQAINITAITPVFMTALFGTGLACIATLVAGAANLGESFAVWLVVGSVAYLAGPVLLTIGYHAPRNDRLAEVQPSSDTAARMWSRYLPGWTAWNHARVVGGLAAAAAFTVALYVA